MDVLIRGRRLALASLIAASSCVALSGCQISYLMKSAYSQADLLRRRIPIEDALKDPSLNEEQKRKLLLAQEARKFAEDELGLAATKNYTTFVQLDRPYVTYVVSAALKTKLEPYHWNYPLVGSLPYKGFFNPDDAKKEAESLKSENLDVFVRGVSAYSTLGWFKDPLLSSMLSYKDHDLVNTVIHETVHATIYVKSEASFNERLASFIGNVGAEAFYAKKEGKDGATLQSMRDDSYNEKLFGEFISAELDLLEKWYESQSNASEGVDEFEQRRKQRIKEIQERFRAQVRPKLKGNDAYRGFEDSEMNNARLLTYRLYFEDLSEFETVFRGLGRDFKKMIGFCKSLEKAENPSAALSEAARKFSSK